MDDHSEAANIVKLSLTGVFGFNFRVWVPIFRVRASKFVYEGAGGATGKLGGQLAGGWTTTPKLLTSARFRDLGFGFQISGFGFQFSGFGLQILCMRVRVDCAAGNLGGQLGGGGRPLGSC